MPRGAIIALCLLLTGCGTVRRTISVTSDPPGALLWLNGREVGRTPVEVDFLYYGDYDVQLAAEGYEPLLTHSEAKAPVWDWIPLDLAAEVTPGTKHARVEWHFQLEPRDDNPAALLDRARELRERVEPAAPVTAANGP